MTGLKEGQEGVAQTMSLSVDPLCKQDSYTEEVPFTSVDWQEEQGKDCDLSLLRKAVSEKIKPPQSMQCSPGVKSLLRNWRKLQVKD